MPDTWYQQALTPPQVLEVNIRIGVVPETDHAQILVEMKDPTTGILLAQRSEPHLSMHGLGRAIDRCVAAAIEWLDVEVEPF
jgi:hypothetical protein